MVRRITALLIVYASLFLIVPAVQSYDFRDGLTGDYFNHWLEQNVIPSYDTTKIEQVHGTQETNINYSLGASFRVEDEPVINSEYEGSFAVMNQPGAFHMLLVRDGIITGGYTSSGDVSIGQMSIGGMNQAKLREVYGEPVDYIRKQWKRLKVDHDEYDVFDVGNYYAYFFYDIHDGYRANGMLIINKDEVIEINDIYNNPPQENNELMHYYLVNATRSEYGYSALERDPAADAAAYHHSRDMAVNNYFDHDSPDGRTLKDRLINGSVDFRLAGENIATGHTSPIFAHHSLMNSPSHRVNVLNDEFNYVGIGIEYSSENIPYYTENYIQR
ncbi:Cysteine-rich secretory protein family protein [Jeotgalicoccus saudimassiliensis]|uniref:Cysteine-rich secretory protein family protein n=1 Tax=Jeotgalicoccus saudimassiliensis TaxID=1461582 RepID=A0A078LX35_9STAP|nr:CAP domain-containing protein [Jeotgalicoccus saudimassiliensis]CDZ99743.1 Cysteine-rich secretory protein family protein [Jeotgalicoccus saudimassiliensis]